MLAGGGDAYGLITLPRHVGYDWKVDPLLILDDRCFGDKGDVEDITEGMYSSSRSVLDRLTNV